jgi:hypothetical protein
MGSWCDIINVFSEAKPLVSTSWKRNTATVPIKKACFTLPLFIKTPSLEPFESLSSPPHHLLPDQLGHLGGHGIRGIHPSPVEKENAVISCIITV